MSEHERIRRTKKIQRSEDRPGPPAEHRNPATDLHRGVVAQARANDASRRTVTSRGSRGSATLSTPDPYFRSGVFAPAAGTIHRNIETHKRQYKGTKTNDQQRRKEQFQAGGKERREQKLEAARNPWKYDKSVYTVKIKPPDDKMPPGRGQWREPRPLEQVYPADTGHQQTADDRDRYIQEALEQVKGAVDHRYEIVVKKDGKPLEESSAEAQSIAKQALQQKKRERQRITGSFNVRGRTEQVGCVVYTDKGRVADAARKCGHTVTAYDAPKEDGMILVIDSAEPKVRVYVNDPGARGPRSDASAGRPGQKLKKGSPAGDTHQQSIELRGKCVTQGDRRGRTLNTVMGMSALNYAESVGFPNADSMNWEWLHLIGHAMGGADHPDNLVAGTYDANTAMIPLESKIVKRSGNKDKNNQRKVARDRPMTVTAKATLWKTPEQKPTWVAKSITLTATNYRETGQGPRKETAIQTLGPINAIRSNKLTRVEYDVYKQLLKLKKSHKRHRVVATEH